MRLPEIAETRERLGRLIQPLEPGDISDKVSDSCPFAILARESVRRRIGRSVGKPLLRIAARPLRSRLNFEISFPYNEIVLGERFADDVSRAALLRKISRAPIKRILIPGCYMGGEDIQFWLRHGIERLDGIDVYSLDKHWSRIVPQLHDNYGVPVTFSQASIESLPFDDGSYDLIATTAVLEHVRNLTAMTAETARVLRPGGWCWHTFGPLYYSYGADHCISAYGFQHGYDHLLLSEIEYREKINDQKFFDKLDDPNLPFWARHDQFSFATARQYLEIFRRIFHVDHVVVKISPEALEFRKQHPEKWQLLLDAGIEEEDLTIKSLAVVLQRKENPALASQPVAPS